MVEKIKTLFMGGKRIGCECLKYLIESGNAPVAVIVNPNDMAKDRWYPSACEIAIKYGIPIFQWNDINSKKAVETIRRVQPDFIVVVYFDQILKKEIIDIPSLGCINLHLALAHEYRGCFPTVWTIINNEKIAGVTIHYIDESIDGGDIIVQRRIDVEDYDTGYSLYHKCTDVCVELFKEIFPKFLEGKKLDAQPQDKTRGKYYRKTFPSHKIDFNKSGYEIYNYIRAMLFDPFPVPYFYIGKQKYEIKKAENNVK